jgi:hypothetical protein
VTGPAAQAPVVLDTSAVLAWLRDEPGAEVVDPLLGCSRPGGERGVDHETVQSPEWSGSS